MVAVTDLYRGISFDVRFGGQRGFAISGGFGAYSALVYSTIAMNVAGASDYQADYAAEIQGRVKQALASDTYLWAPAKTRGPREVWSGGCVLHNSDGALDWMSSVSFNRQQFSVFVARRNARTAGNYAILFGGYVENMSFGTKEIIFHARDVLWALDTPVLTDVYAGNNSLPNGLEGNAADIGGRKKPGILGWVFNISPPCVNTSRLIYQLEGKFGFYPGWTVAVRDSGVALTAGAQYTSQTDMETNAPAAGQYRVWIQCIPAPSQNAITTSTTGGTLAAGTYYYVITARNVNGETIASNERSITTTGATSSNQLSWTAVSGAVGYYVYRGTSPGGENVAVLVGNVTDLLDTGTAWSARTPITTPTASIGAFIRLNSTPTGQLTADVKNPSPYSSASTAINELANRLLSVSPLYYLSYPGATPVNTGALPDAGVYLLGDVTYLDALNSLTAGRSLGLQHYNDLHLNYDLKLYMYELQDPTSGPSVFDLNSSNIVNADDPVRKIVSGDDDRGIPVWRVTLYYKRNYTVQQGTQLAGAVSAADRAMYGTEWRSVVAADTSVQTTWPQAPEISVYSLLPDQTAAQTEANRLLALYKVRRDMIEVDVPLSAGADWINSDYQPAPQLGTIVTLTYGRLGFDAGKKMQVIGARIDCARSVRTLTLWG